jgi:hypothetical protein
MFKAALLVSESVRVRDGQLRGALHQTHFDKTTQIWYQ